MKKIYQYILMAVAVVAMASCSQEEMFEPAVLQAMNFQVSDFPAFGESAQTRAIGTPEDGKTAWVEGDQLFITFNSPKCGVQTATLTYTASQWASTENIMFEYVPGETPEITAVYAPSYNFDASSGNLTLKEGEQAGTDEYLQGTGAFSADSKAVNITFCNRTYSRLRIAAEKNETLTVTTTGFTPVGATTTAPASYTFTTNANGNAYLYGSFAEDATASLKQGNATLDTYTFTADKYPDGTAPNKSYAWKPYQYIALCADSEQTFSVTLSGSHTIPTSMQYSVGGGTWTTLTSTSSVTFGGEHGTLRLRATGNSIGTANNYYNDYMQFVFSNNNVPVECHGDIRTLIDYKKYTTVSTASARFCNLFKNCKALTTAPKLPATTLAEDCYSYMFQNCTGLTSAPALPATTLATQCYQAMFSGCTGLTSTPALPATTLASHCYFYMFSGCTGLTSAPALPATTLVEFCYQAMFEGCTGLSSAPELPATTLATDCYYRMFYGCSGLISAPALPATRLSKNCYQAMFYGCTGLTSAPALPATTLATQCCRAMFYGCTGLTSAPALPATTLATQCYDSMFYGCTNLNYIKMMATDVSATNCLKNWVSGVSSTGTFEKSASMTRLRRGADGIPSGWTVVDITE